MFECRVSENTSDWQERILNAEVLIDAYKDYVAVHELVPEIDIWSADPKNELLWSTRLKGREKPD